MTARHNSAFSPHVFARGMLETSCPDQKRAHGTPGAQSTRSLARRKNKSHQHSHHEYPGSPDVPRTMGYSLLRALPGEPGFFATVIDGIASTDLDTSVGVSGPHDFAVRLRRLRPGTLRVHRIPPRVNDDLEPPLCGTGRGRYRGGF
jgi:hypothetical protein